MGAGLAKQIRTMFPQVYEMYQRNCTKVANRQDLLGKVLFCPIRYNGCEYYDDLAKNAEWAAWEKKGFII